MSFKAETTATGTAPNGDPIALTVTCDHWHLTKASAGRCAPKLTDSLRERLAPAELAYTSTVVPNRHR